MRKMTDLPIGVLIELSYHNAFITEKLANNELSGGMFWMGAGSKK